MPRERIFKFREPPKRENIGMKLDGCGPTHVPIRRTKSLGGKSDKLCIRILGVELAFDASSKLVGKVEGQGHFAEMAESEKANR